MDANRFTRRLTLDESSTEYACAIAACAIPNKEESRHGMMVFYMDQTMYIEYENFLEANRSAIRKEHTRRYKL